MIVEYMRHRNNLKQLVTPDFVDDGGYFLSPIDSTLVGWINEPREHFVPDSVVTLTKATLANRLADIHMAQPYRDEQGNTLSDAAVRDMAAAWASARS